MLALNTNLTAEQRLIKATTAIMNHPQHVALAGVLMIGTKTVRDDVPTAATNGRDEYYGRAFVDSLTDAELRFIVLHECYHKLFKHLTTWGHLWKKNADLANAACDFVINGKLIRLHGDDKFATMTGPLASGCYDPKYDDKWDAARVFHDLQQEQEGGDGGDGGGDGGEPDGEGDKRGKPGPYPPKGGGGDPFDDHNWKEAEELSDEEKRELEKGIDEAIRQGALVAGKVGTNVGRDITALLQPQVNWRDVLREFVTTTCKGNDFGTWAKPNRRFLGAGVYMPSPISEKVEELVVAIDTSGSIGQRQLTTFLSEVMGICETVKPSRVRLLYWTTRVAGDECYEEHNMQTLAQSTKPAGYGGTDVTCVPEYITEHGIKPQAVVVLTDGELYAGWGQWSCPVLWCILDNDRAKPDMGQAVHIKSEAL